MSANETNSKYNIGDWVVHRQHGAGQIKKIQSMEISGNENQYYRIETPASTVWVPVDDLTRKYFRPLATEDEVEEAIKILQQPAQKMDSHFKNRQIQIDEVMSRNSFIDIARMVRDLQDRQKQSQTLSRTERDALRHFTENLLIEWSLCLGKEVSELRPSLNTLLHKDQAGYLAAS